MERVGEHRVPVGPLAVRWLAYELPELRAGTGATLRVRLRNEGTASWRSRAREGVQASYHWLDPRGNPIVWDGPRVAFPLPVRPGDETQLDLPLHAPQPPGRYRLSIDLVDESRFWFAEVGSATLDLDVEVRPRIEERRLAVTVHGGRDRETERALAAQEEPLVETEAVATAHLVPGALPAPDWSRRVLDAHAEGYAAVGGSVEPLARLPGRRDARRFAPWAPGGGRNPSFEHPLLLPSLLAGLEPVEHEGFPAWRPGGETWLFDGRIALRLRPRRGRPRG